jgi:hypothetical protein
MLLFPVGGVKLSEPRGDEIVDLLCLRYHVSGNLESGSPATVHAITQIVKQRQRMRKQPKRISKIEKLGGCRIKCVVCPG